MLEATANFIGKDGFNWWVGQVENTGGNKKGDADYTNKVKVRIVGYHNPSKKELKTEDLPWAMVAFPATQPQKSGAGTNHQLVENGWVIGFFMDGASAQIPIVLGSIGDENPDGVYGTTDDGSPFPQLVPPAYQKRVHGTTGSMPPGTGPTVETSETTGLPGPAGESTSNSEESSSSVNQRGPKEPPSNAMEAADKKKCYTVHVGNGKCGSENSVKLEGVLAEFMKFARGIEENEIGQFINSATGEVVNFGNEVANVVSRIQAKMSALLANIKGVVLKEVNKFIKKALESIAIPNPDLAEPVKKQLKSITDLINCLFSQLLGDLTGFLTGMLTDLVTKALDTALCLVEKLLGDIMGKVMGLINQAMSMINGILGAIKGAASLIQGLLSKILDFLDLFCDGALSCSLGLSTFETCQGGNAKGNDAKSKEISQYGVKPPNSGEVIGNGKPNAKGYVPFLEGGVQYAFNTKTGEKIQVDTTLDPEGFANKTGISSGSFDTRGPLEKFEDFNFYDSDGNVQSEALNCNNSILNRKPCFPKMVWDNLQSTLPVRALPIVDDIGSILGVLVQKKGYNVNAEASVRAMFTCNEPEGSGAKFRPVITDGIISGIDVLKSGLGYGFDPSETYCPKEQYVALLTPSVATSEFKEGDLLELVKTAAGGVDPDSPDVLQVYDLDYNGTGKIAVATIDPLFESDLVPGLIVKTKSGTEVKINFDKKFAELIIPPDATALYAGCIDLIPLMEDIKTVNVGSGYTDPKIYVGDDEVGDATTDADGKIVKLNLQKPVLGFSKPEVRDNTGTGAVIVGAYNFVGPRDLKNKLGTTSSYIDCVEHKTQLVGYVNGQPYYGLYHSHEGRKMTGPIHTDQPHDYIYDTVAESLSGNVILSGSSETTTSTTTQTETTTPTINTAGTTVVDTPTLINPGTSTSTGTTDTTTGTDTGSSGGGGSTPSYGY